MLQIGLLFAAMTAVAKAAQSIFKKKSALDTDEFLTAWSSRFFGLVVLIPLNIYYGLPELSLNILKLMIPVGLLIALASILQAKAYKRSDVSLVTPIFAFEPILLIFTSFFLLGEFPSIAGLGGILLIAFGTYFLKTGSRENILEPLKKVFSDRGVQFILLVVGIYSITANIDKIGVQSTSPLFWGLAIYSLSSLFLSPVVLRKSDGWSEKIQVSWRPLLVLGLLGGISIAFQMAAFELTLVSYVVAIKRLSIPIAVFLGYLVFNEENFRGRLLGSIIIVTGALLIYFSI